MARKVPGIKLLCLDAGGGVRSLLQLYMLNEVMRRLQEKLNTEEVQSPCDHFDIIAGSGASGILAILLGRLRMNVNEAIYEYRKLGEEVYTETNKRYRSYYYDGPESWDRLSSFERSTLVNHIRDLAEARKMGKTMNEDEWHLRMGKTLLCGWAEKFPDNNIRTYADRQALQQDPSQSSILGQSSEEQPISIWMAAWANAREDEYMECGNKSWARTLREQADHIKALKIVPAAVREIDQGVSCVVSLGTGYSNISDIEKELRPSTKIEPSKRRAAYGDLVAIFAESLGRKTGRLLNEKFPTNPNNNGLPGSDEFYFRFNMAGVDRLDIFDWPQSANLYYIAREYLADPSVSSRIDKLVDVIISGGPAVPAQLLQEALPLMPVTG